MPRKLRLEFPGAMYHVCPAVAFSCLFSSPGDQREDIFLYDVDSFNSFNRCNDFTIRRLCLLRFFCVFRVFRGWNWIARSFARAASSTSGRVKKQIPIEKKREKGVKKGVKP
jgi:hypothetical protein